MHAVILAGGEGKRFWPLSTAEKPKQFIDIAGYGSMLSVTFNRISNIVPPERILIFTVRRQYDLVRSELPDIPAGNIFAEPVGRNTAPSLAVAAMMVLKRWGDDPMICCPSDHIISGEEEFCRVASAAAGIAGNNDVLVTLGIRPDRPATGYGYIECGKPFADDGESPGERGKEERSPFMVRRFHEKPAAEVAEGYLERGGFLWNSGMFIWRPSVFLSAWNSYVPEGAGPLDRMAASMSDDPDIALIDEEYPKMPSLSVDYGILEKAGNVLVIPADIGWTDVGSWDALYEMMDKDADGNAARGAAVSVDASGNLFFNPRGKTAAVGVHDLIVVSDGGNVLVCRRGQSQRVKDLLEDNEETD